MEVPGENNVTSNRVKLLKLGEKIVNQIRVLFAVL